MTDERPNAPAPGLNALAIALAGGRVAIGAGLWLAPQLAARALGFGRLDERALALARIAASRDLVLGAGGLRARGDARALRRAAVAAAAADGGDAVAFALLLASGEHRGAAVRGLLGAAPASLAGLWLARRLGKG